MQNTKKIRLIGGIAGIAVLLCIAAAVIIIKFNGGNEDYRSISVFDLSASATVTRDGTALDAYSGMKLMNGDNVKVGDDGYICLLLDDDKYVTLETGTEINLNASGDKENSRTNIELVSGAVLNEIDSKLSDDSSYELSTPVSVMAVRGTVFRVALTTEGDECQSEVIVLDGQVAASAVLSDGTVSSDEILVDAGKAAGFKKTDADSDPVYSPMEISYEDLPADTLAAILKIYENGRLSNLSITKDDLQKLCKKKTDPNDDSSDTESSSDASSSDSDQDVSNSDDDGNSVSDDAGYDDDDDEYSDDDSDSDSSADTPDNDSSSNTSSSSSSKKPASKQNTKSGAKPTAKPSTKSGTKPAAKSTSKPNKNPETVPTRKPGGEPTVNAPSTPSPTAAAITHTVTFLDTLGNIFGTQTITSGSHAQKPRLSPSGGANWYDAQGNVYDFNTPVTSDLTLYYR